ncbi:MAG: phosphoenolpyruvate synthase, partial [Bacteroidales bacterium]|nr:phosphoenolpyruvate synthase [Bacteroidales bacterium]
YFPLVSGVARSLNFYPVGNEKSEDGIVKLAYGLGKAVVEGEQVLRFSPNHPKHVLQTSTPELTMTQTQQYMFALNLSPEQFKTSVDDAVNFDRIRISDCGRFESLKKVVSTWDEENARMVDSPWPEGPKFVTFAPMLKFGSLPVAAITRRLMDVLKAETKCDIEIEFAIKQSDEENSYVFNVLQVRPISTDTRKSEVDWKGIDTSDALITSSSALGTGWIEGVRDVVYLRRENFDKMDTHRIAAEVSEINSIFRNSGEGYVLIGYGRWGSSIPSLGVPVKWSDISAVETLVECSLEDFRVEPSQGTHFFQNLTSFNVGYINVDTFSRSEDRFNYEALEAMPALHETKYLRHVRFEKPLSICIDGRANRAVILNNK